MGTFLDLSMATHRRCYRLVSAPYDPYGVPVTRGKPMKVLASSVLVALVVLVAACSSEVRQLGDDAVARFKSEG